MTNVSDNLYFNYSELLIGSLWTDRAFHDHYAHFLIERRV